MRKPCWHSTAFMAMACFGALWADDALPVRRFDFERAGLAEDWTASGPLQAARLPTPAPFPESPAGIEPPQGSAIKLVATGPGTLLTHPGKVPQDWQRLDRIEFWLYRPPNPHAIDKRNTKRGDGSADALEVHLLEADLRATRWRRVELPDSGWRHVRLPLRWFRQGSAAIARWNRIDRLAIRLRGEGEVWIDNLALVAGERERAVEILTDELAALAFRGDPNTRTLRRPHVEILTNTPKLDLEKLADHLQAVREAMERDLPFLFREPAVSPPRLVVFADAGQFRAFVPRWADPFGARAAAPQSQGFTFLGLAMSSWEDRFGSLRPVYTHEFVHVVLEQYARLPNRSEWLQEGIASRYQLAFHPQANFSGLVRQGLHEPEFRSPLNALCSGKYVALSRYWQAATFFEMLMREEPYRSRLEELFESLRRQGSTDLGPQLGPLFRKDWTALELDWKTYCAKRHGG